MFMNAGRAANSAFDPPRPEPITGAMVSQVMKDSEKTASNRMLTFVITILVIAVIIAAIYFVALTPETPR
jgi:uncharacterized membrane protein